MIKGITFIVLAPAISAGYSTARRAHQSAVAGAGADISGTSTYWHNPFWAPLAQAVYDRMLETGMKEIGVTGSFNYTVTRTSRLPAILVG